jgi:peptidoglycan/LPS O-acetylase OafA/YrhL
MSETTNRFGPLDGWRGISILLVLATHFLPLGPKAWQLNDTSGPMGMALFFTLSGFLITNFLLHKASVTDFLIRRLARIVPLAWLFMLIALPLAQASLDAWVAHFLFYANWPPIQLTNMTSHIWSVCVEMQFYLGIALIFALFRETGLLLLPALCVAITIFRVANGAHIGINTYYRVDEILAGAVLALAFNDRLGLSIKKIIGNLNPFVLALLLVISCHPKSGFMNYFRPYLAALLVGWTLFNEKSRLSEWLKNHVLSYIAEISYALYVIHPLFGHTWLGSGEGWTKYVKRPLLFAVVFLLAHLSTFHYEHRCIAFGKRLSARLTGKAGLTDPLNRPKGG